MNLEVSVGDIINMFRHWDMKDVVRAELAHELLDSFDDRGKAERVIEEFIGEAREIVWI